MAYSVIPVMVYVFPLLVCPYAKTLAGKYIDHNINEKWNSKHLLSANIVPELVKRRQE